MSFAGLQSGTEGSGQRRTPVTVPLVDGASITFGAVMVGKFVSCSRANRNVRDSSRTPHLAIPARCPYPLRNESHQSFGVPRRGTRDR